MDTAGQAHYIKDGSRADLHDRDYIQQALSGKQMVSDVLISRVINAPVVILAVPITSEGAVAGALIGRKNGSFLADICAQTKSGKSGYAFMVNNQGTLIAHPDSSLVMNQFNPIKEAAKNPLHQSLATAIQTALHGGQGIVEYKYNGKKQIAAYTSIDDFGWVFFTNIEYDEFMSGLYQVRNFIILLVIVFLIAGIAAGAMLSRSITKPIAEIDSAAHKLAHLDFDITLQQNRRDELGKLQASLLVIRDNMKKKIDDMYQEQMSKQIGIANNLKKVIVSTSEQLAVITGTMDSVMEKTISQASSVDQTSGTVEEITHNINDLDAAVETQMIHISRSSESIEQLVKDTESVRVIVRNAGKTTLKMGESAEASKMMLKQLTEELKRIGEQSVFLEQANITLVNIAAQTNILAMNAAIEAAHAGESGKGFAVVAGEIRKLAQSSDKESSSISDEIRKMRSGIAAIQEASNKTVDAMTNMFTEVTDMGASFDTVNSAVEAQASNSSQILHALETLKETAGLVKKGSGNIQKQSGLIQKAVKDLENISKEVSGSVLDAESATKDIKNALETAHKIAEGR